MLPFKQDIIYFARIDLTNTSFRITTESKADDLVGSIKQVGLINPPILIPQAQGFIVVSGFRRIAAASCLGWEKIPVRLLPESISERRCAELAVMDNAFQRSLNLIEISRCLVLLSKNLQPSESMIKEARKLGLPANKDYCKKVQPLSLLPWPIQEALLSNAIALPTALTLADLVPQDAIRMANFLKYLQCSLNRQREIITLLSEIGLSENISINEILEAPAVQSVIENSDVDKNQKTRIITGYLKRRRYPAISAAEAYFEKQVAKLKLGNRIRLSPPKYFEGTTFGLTLHFDTLDELKMQCRKLNKAIEDPVLTEILE